MSAIEAFGVRSGEDAWIFAYGSLMWAPEFSYVSRHKAVVEGYHRRFCVLSKQYRGTPQKPGLVLGLDTGGRCEGLAFEVDASQTEEVFERLWQREMTPPGIYLPRRIVAHFNGQEVQTCAFVVNPEHPDYFSDSDALRMAAMIAHGSGARGSNVEYLEDTLQHLQEIGVNDPGLVMLSSLVSSFAQAPQAL